MFHVFLQPIFVCRGDPELETAQYWQGARDNFGTAPQVHFGDLRTLEKELASNKLRAVSVVQQKTFLSWEDWWSPKLIATCGLFLIRPTRVKVFPGKSVMNKSCFKNLLLFLVFMQLICLPLSAFSYDPPWYQDPATVPWSPIFPGDLPAGAQELHATYHSVMHNKDIGFLIYLPPSYASNPSKRFPLIVDLHGTGSSYLYGSPRFYYLGMNAASIPESIWVAANGFAEDTAGAKVNGSYWMDYYTPLGLTEPVKAESTLVSELIPYLERNYRVGTGQANKVVVGFSMGGYGAIRYGIKHGIFNCAMSLDGSLTNVGNESVGFRIACGNDAAVISQNNIFNVLKENYLKARAVHFYMLVSGNYPADQQALAKAMTVSNVPNEVEKIPGLAHNPDSFFKLRGHQILSFLKKCLVVPSNVDVFPTASLSIPVNGASITAAWNTTTSTPASDRVGIMTKGRLIERLACR